MLSIRDGRVIAFIIPFNKTMASIYVRAMCLKGYESNNWKFSFIEGNYPRLLNFKLIRAIYRLSFYFFKLLKLKILNKDVVVIGIKLESLILINMIKKILRLKLILDINDPYHSSPGITKEKAKKILQSADYLIFESLEYMNYWNKTILPEASIIEDTPQHEFIYDNFDDREFAVTWIGSPITSPVLIDFLPHLLLFNKLNYCIKLLGASEDVNNQLKSAGIKTTLINNYDHTSLVKHLSQTQLSFVPMLDIDWHKLRGNLKAKISMGCGCLTIASRNEAHERLIEHANTGFLFDSLNELEVILSRIRSSKYNIREIALNGNKKVAENYTLSKHASSICDIADGLIVADEHI